MKISSVFLNFRDLVNEDDVWNDKESQVIEKWWGMGDLEVPGSSQSEILISVKLLSTQEDEREKLVNTIIQESKLKMTQYLQSIFYLFAIFHFLVNNSFKI